jgi:hypothetical protein
MREHRSGAQFLCSNAGLNCSQVAGTALRRPTDRHVMETRHGWLPQSKT